MNRCFNKDCKKYSETLYNHCLSFHDVSVCGEFEELNEPFTTNKIQPPYYSNNNSIDVIDFCQMLDLDFMQGNVIKYIVRYKNKNGIEDVKKAREYCDRIIKKLEENK